jgi:hypothetical protein
MNLAEPLLDEAKVMVDHDLAMVWTPYYFLQDGEITHVGTNCFTLLRANWENNARYDPYGEDVPRLEWRVTGMVDTAREPTQEDLDRIHRRRG